MIQKKIYIAGKISGLEPAKAKEKFSQTETILAELGYKPQNPFRLIGNINLDRVRRKALCLTDQTHRDEIMRICLRAMLKADAILMLDNWEDSKGARHEHLVASLVNLPTYYSIHELLRKESNIK